MLSNFFIIIYFAIKNEGKRFLEKEVIDELSILLRGEKNVSLILFVLGKGMMEKNNRKSVKNC